MLRLSSPSLAPHPSPWQSLWLATLPIVLLELMNASAVPCNAAYNAVHVTSVRPTSALTPLSLVE